MGTTDAGLAYRQSEIIGALSHALDLTEGQPVGHSQRSCMISMELAERLDLPPRVRQDLFYATLLKDAGCSSSAARMCELFDTDDRALKREFSFVDWTSASEFISFAARNVSPGSPGIVRAGQLLRALRGISREADVAQQRPLRARRPDREQARLLDGDGRRRAGARRALGRQRPARRPRGPRDPSDLAHHLPRPDRRDLHVGRRPRRGPRRGARAPRALVRPGDRRRLPVDRPGRPPVDADGRRLGRRGPARPGARGPGSRSPTRTASTAWPRRSPA